MLPRVLSRVLTEIGVFSGVLTRVLRRSFPCWEQQKEYAGQHPNFWEHLPVHSVGDAYDWTTGGPYDGNEWKRHRVVSSVHLCISLFMLILKGLGAKWFLDFEGRHGITSLFHCAQKFDTPLVLNPSKGPWLAVSPPFLKKESTYFGCGPFLHTLHTPRSYSRTIWDLSPLKQGQTCSGRVGEHLPWKYLLVVCCHLSQLAWQMPHNSKRRICLAAAVAIRQGLSATSCCHPAPHNTFVFAQTPWSICLDDSSVIELIALYDHCRLICICHRQPPCSTENMTITEQLKSDSLMWTITPHSPLISC